MSRVKGWWTRNALSFDAVLFLLLLVSLGVLLVMILFMPVVDH